MYSFPMWSQSIVSSLVLTVASWPAHRFLRRQVRWAGIPVFLRTFHSLLWSTESKSSPESMKQKSMFFWNPFAFSMIQQMLAIWSLIPLPFLNSAWTSGSSRFTYCWSLSWRALSITAVHCLLYLKGRPLWMDFLEAHLHCKSLHSAIPHSLNL